MVKKRSPLQISFNTRIYKKEVVRKAIAAYSSVAQFSVVKDKGNYMKVEIKNAPVHLKCILTDELGNYVLGMTKNALRYRS